MLSTSDQDCTTKPAIQVDHLDKRFGATHALRDVSLTCQTADIHAIAGQNGAGKSTLVKILSGVLGATEYTGEIAIGGRRCEFSNIRDAERAGVFLVPQELHVVPQLSAGEYLFLNREPESWGLVDTQTLWSETAKWLEIFQLSASPVTLMGELGPQQQQMVCIARAMTQGVKVLILDEPTASLTDHETDLLFGQINELRQKNVTTLYVSHRLAELERIASRVTVLRDGAVVATFELNNQQSSARRIIKAMIGREVVEMYPKVEVPRQKELLALRDWVVRNPVPGRPALIDGLSLDVCGGEVVGVFGMPGSGALDLARSIFGVHPGRTAGDLMIQGRKVHVNNAREAVKSGLAYLPSDRKRDGLVLSMPVSSNLTLPAHGRLTNFGLVNRRRELQEVRRYVAALEIKCSSPEDPIAGLSGGNQQKVMIAKWLLSDPTVFLLEEPTRGVDVGARLEIYRLMNELTAKGRAILLISTDLSEILGMSDRVLVMRQGRVVSRWRRGEVSEEEVMLNAAGNRDDVKL